MRIRTGLAKAYNLAAAGILGGALLASAAPVAAQETPGEAVTPLAVAAANSCPAFADFKRPVTREFRLAKQRIEPDPFIRTQQEYLEILGLDDQNSNGINGMRTRQSLREFQFFWGPVFHGTRPNGKFDEETVEQLRHFADLAYKDSKVYGIPTDAAAAIRLSQLYTGIEFGLIMELTSVESGFRSTAKAKTSSAKGLQQFIDRTWLNMVRQYGHKYGLETYAAQISYYKDDYGRDTPVIENPIVHRQVLEMKNNPRLSALMAGDFALENKAKLSCFLKKDITRTDLYIAHFLGPNDAVLFLDALQKAPESSAADMFPEAADANRPIFFNWRAKERSFREIYEIFDRRFNLGRYEDWATDADKAAKINAAYSLKSYTPAVRKPPVLKQDTVVKKKRNGKRQRHDGGG